MYRKILIPLDGSPFAEFALGPGLALARALPAQVELVSVQDPVPTFAFGEWDTDPQAWRRDYLDEAGQRVAGETGIEPETAIRVGRVENELVEEIQESDADLVVVATHGRGPFSRFWIGSVADALVRRSPRPVLLVRPEEDEEPDLGQRTLFQKILVPLDESRESESVLAHVKALAELAEVEVLLLHVVHFPTEFVSSYPPDTVKMNEQVVEEGYERAQAYLERVASDLKDDGLDVSTRVRVEVHPAAGIVHTAEEEGVDLVAMATHGRGGLGRTLLGSVTDKVVRGVHRPILTVRPEEGSTEAVAGEEES